MVFAHPKPVERVWGGSRLGFGERVGEVWLLEEPLLIKLIDPADWLSVQVHPPDAYALAREKRPGKTEAWYVLAEGEIVYGFNRPVTREEVRERAQTGALDEVLNRLWVRKGEVVYIPAGTVHALGPGTMVYEVQQPSDLTYRIYDYGRPRELHLEKALEVAILEPTPLPRFEPLRRGGGVRLMACPYFALYRYDLRGPLHLEAEKPLALTLLEGEAVLSGPGGPKPLRFPDTVLLETGEEARLEGEGVFLGASLTDSTPPPPRGPAP
ncbi:MAG: mannose-6-phosphate isomerase [Thermus sp.]